MAFRPPISDHSEQFDEAIVQLTSAADVLTHHVRHLVRHIEKLQESQIETNQAVKSLSEVVGQNIERQNRISEILARTLKQLSKTVENLDGRFGIAELRQCTTSGEGTDAARMGDQY